MKQYIIPIIAAALLVGCGEAPPPKPPDISLFEAALAGDLDAVKQHISAVQKGVLKPNNINTNKPTQNKSRELSIERASFDVITL